MGSVLCFSLCANNLTLVFQILAGIAAGAIAVVVAFVLGVVLSRKSSSSLSSDSVSGDPSDFTKDSRLKQSFWGIAYTPEGTLYPVQNFVRLNFPPALHHTNILLPSPDVVTDIQLLSQLTTVRLLSSLFDIYSQF